MVVDELGLLPINIAEYVFFPLSHLFRQARSLPSKALELSLNCLQVLLTGSWCHDVNSEAHLQLLSLLTYLISGPHASGSIYIPDEAVVLAALKCLNQLFTPAVCSSYSNHIAISQSKVIILGHVTSTLIDCIPHLSNELSTASSQSLNYVILAVQNKNVLRKFTPGIMSTVVGYLQPSTWSRKSARSIVAALSVLESLLTKVLMFDEKLEPDLDPIVYATGSPETEDNWLQNCLPQIRNALLSVLRIKTIKKKTIAEGLLAFCYSLLSLSNRSLDCLMGPILETMLELSGGGNVESHQERDSHWARLISLLPQFTPVLKEILHRWLTAMPRLVLLNDTPAFHEHLNKIATAYKVAKAAEVDITILDIDLVTQVLDSATAVLDVNSTTFLPLLRTDTNRATPDGQNHVRFQDLGSFVEMPPSARSGKSLEEIQLFVKALSYENSLSSLESYLSKSSGAENGRPRLAHLWISSRIMDASVQQGPQSTRHAAKHLSFYNAIYNSSLGILAASSLEPTADWRIQAIALEIVAMYALVQGPMFRSELVDILFPMVESLASPNPQLRESAWLCISTVSQACGYVSTNELILQNVDYLINSVALKINVSAISLEAPKALVMMVRICRVTIVPYLDDIIGSVFSTLAAYHGYTQLVEALFEFLSTVVSASTQSQIVGMDVPINRTVETLPIGRSSIMRLVRVLRTEPHADREIDTSNHAMALPEDKSSVEDRTTFEKEPSVTAELKLISATIPSIVAFGQHYLTHDSPTLRCQVLNLVGQSCAVLSTDENRFLPLIHEIWPVVIKRLYDSEASVCIAACDTIAEFVSHAGEFMQMRIEDEWPDLSYLYRQKCYDLEREKGSRHSRGQVHYTWGALTTMFCSLIKGIKVNANIEDEIVEMLVPYYDSHNDVRYALDGLNPDAIWLQNWLGDAPKMLKSQPQFVGHVFIDPVA